MSNPIPDGWENTEIGSYVGVQGGCAFKSEDFCETGIPIVRISNIKKDGSIDLSGSIFAQYDLALSKFQIRNGDVLIAMSGATTGKVGRYRSNSTAYLNQRVGRFYVRDDSKVELDFVHQVTSTSQFIGDVLIDAAGGAQPNISNQQIEAFNILLPPLPEQQKIATILSSVDDVIEKTRAQINKLKDLKTGMMQELLTKGIGHTEFKDSPVGRIPASWDFVTIADCTTRFYQGINTVADNVIYQHQGVQIIQAKHITSGKLNFNDARYISNDDYCRYKNKFQPCIDDVLFSNIGTIGKSVIVHEEYSFLIAWNVFLMRVEKHVQPKFMHYFLQYLDWMNFYDDLMTGNATKFVNKSSLGSVVIPVPSKKEQTQIISAIDSIDKRLEVMTNKLGTVLSIKKALMQDLLTGKVRVKLTDKESAVV